VGSVGNALPCIPLCKNVHVTTHIAVVCMITAFCRRVNEIFTFFLSNQPDALIIPILFYYKTLHVSGICDHHQEFSTVHSALVSFMQVSDDGFQAESGWN